MARKPRGQGLRMGERRPGALRKAARRQTTRPVPARPLCGAERVSTPETLLTSGVPTKRLRMVQPWSLERKLRGEPLVVVVVASPLPGLFQAEGPATCRLPHGQGQVWPPNWSAEPASHGASCWPIRQPRDCALPDLNHGRVHSLLERGTCWGWAGAVACQGVHSPSRSGPDAPAGGQQEGPRLQGRRPAPHFLQNPSFPVAVWLLLHHLFTSPPQHSEIAPPSPHMDSVCTSIQRAQQRLCRHRATSGSCAGDTPSLLRFSSQNLDPFRHVYLQELYEQMTFKSLTSSGGKCQYFYRDFTDFIN